MQQKAMKPEEWALKRADEHMRNVMSHGSQEQVGAPLTPNTAVGEEKSISNKGQ